MATTVRPTPQRQAQPRPATPPETSLDQLGPGSRAEVRRVGGDPVVRQRLLEMGLVAGSSVRVVRWAPLGDPMQIELLGSHLSLRRSEARAILVRSD
ncbi:MAG: FeoA family protein [Planctomycetota bacterium]|jgi:ferrous iron transport protein A